METASVNVKSDHATLLNCQIGIYANYKSQAGKHSLQVHSICPYPADFTSGHKKIDTKNCSNCTGKGTYGNVLFMKID